MHVGPFVVHVAPLRRSGARWHEWRWRARSTSWASTRAAAPCPRRPRPSADVVARAFAGGIDAVGTVRAPWVGDVPALRGPGRAASSSIAVRERFGDRARSVTEDDEAYPIVDDSMDLGPLVRDAIVLELPLAPLCRRGLPGPVPAVRGRPQRGRVRLRCPGRPAVG